MIIEDEREQNPKIKLRMAPSHSESDPRYLQAVVDGWKGIDTCIAISPKLRFGMPYFTIGIKR